jgi:hypothetical protein
MGKRRTTERYVPRERHNTVDGTTWWCAWDTEKECWATLLYVGKYKTRKACQQAIRFSEHPRYNMPDEIFNILSNLCDKAKIDWFYNEYRDSASISKGDLQMLLDAFYVSSPLPQVLKDWLDSNGVKYIENPSYF